MGHTQTKLCISSESQTIIKCADFMGETSVIFASASGYNGSGFFPHDDEAPHNASRLVACWNWCDGLSTEVLETHLSAGRTAEDFAISSVGRESALGAERDAMKAQRDELLAALKSLKDHCQEAKKALDAEIANGLPVHPVSASLTWPTSVAITAIANAEKGGT